MNEKPWFCPACRSPLAGEFYGPCEACRLKMREHAAVVFFVRRLAKQRWLA